MKILIYVTVFLGFQLLASSQTFLPAFDMFSKGKPCYVTLKDGTKVEGKIKSLNRRKGNIEKIDIIDQNDKRLSYEAKDIKEMYLPPHGLEKIVDMNRAIYDVRTYSGEINTDQIQNGMAYFVSVSVIIKKEPEILLMQVVNPTFSSKIMVFHDPYATETTSYGLSGITLAGGEDKSYFVKIGDKPAYKLKKKNYKEDFESIFNSCPEIISKYKLKIDWLDFNEHVYECTTGIDVKASKKKK